MFENRLGLFEIQACESIKLYIIEGFKEPNESSQTK